MIAIPRKAHDVLDRNYYYIKLRKLLYSNIEVIITLDNYIIILRKSLDYGSL